MTGWALLLYADLTDAGLDRAQVAAALLRVAGDPKLVQTTGRGFRIPAAWMTDGRLSGILTKHAVQETAPPVDAPTAGPLFDPAEHTEREIIAHLEASGFDEQVRVVTAEVEGRNRARVRRWRPKSPGD